MGKVYPDIGPRMRTFIERQPLFFVATAPLAADGHINLSPKGRSGTPRVLDPRRLAYLDVGGSHAETIAHLRNNGRITLMWCSFSGPPTIVRVHGRGEPVFRDDPRFPGLLAAVADPRPTGAVPTSAVPTGAVPTDTAPDGAAGERPVDTVGGRNRPTRPGFRTAGARPGPGRRRSAADRPG
jgi:hypothetical protein